MHRRRSRRPARFEGLSPAPGFGFRLFNIFDDAARQILLDHPPMVRAFQEQLQGKPIHLLIVGLSQLGVSLVLHAAQLFHGGASDLLHITVVDSARNFESSAFRFHYPRIDRAVSLNLVPLEPKVFSLATVERLSAVEPFSAIYLALGDPLLNRQCAKIIRGQPGLDPQVPVVFVGSGNAGQPEETSENPACGSLFDIFATTCHVDALLREPQDDLPRAFHRRLLEAAECGKGVAADQRHVPWERLRPDLKEHFRVLADHLRVKLRTLGCVVAPVSGGGSRRELSESELETLIRIESQRRVVEALLLPSDLHEPPELSRDAEEEECSDHVRSIPGVLSSLDLQIVQLP